MLNSVRALLAVVLVAASFGLEAKAEKAPGPIKCGDRVRFETNHAGASISGGHANPTLACNAAKVLLQANLITGGPGCAECDIPEACFPGVSLITPANLTSSEFFDPLTGTWGCTAKYTGQYFLSCSKCK